MVVVFDTNYLVLLLQTNPIPIEDPETKEEIRDVKERIEQILRTLNKEKAKILIPTPVLAETFTRFGGKTNEIVQALTSSYSFQFADFNQAAAIETGMAFYAARQQGDKKSGSRRTWERVKFDRQIVSIAKVNKAEIVYSNDGQVRKWSEALGMLAVPVWKLDSPPPRQMEFEARNQATDVETTDET